MFDHLTLEYHLEDLPTAQHKAGLAGLLMLVNDLRSRGQIEMPEPKVTPYAASLTFNQQQLQALFDDWYDAERVEVFSASKYPGKPPKREEFVNVKRGDKEKQEKRYVYDAFQPKGVALRRWLPSGPGSPWLKLWQDMLWNVLRAQPKTRGEYEIRANGDPVKAVGRFWEKLSKQTRNRQEGEDVVDSIAGSVFIGAQDKNAERVSFHGSIDQNLLLHFWSLSSPIFVPRILDIKQKRTTHVGFLIAVPEVRDLNQFVPAMLDYWHRVEETLVGYRPRSSLIDLPEEGGLEFFYHLARKELDRNVGLLDSVSTVELYHLNKQGNNVRMLTATHVRPDTKMLARYSQLRDLIAHPIFKAMQINNLLQGLEWHARAAYWLDKCPAEYFVRPSATPGLSSFGRDVRRIFKQHIELLKDMEELDMSIEDADMISRQVYRDEIARRVYRVVGDYVRRRTQERVVRGSSEREAKEKVALDAFLAMRGRSVQEFIGYFTGTLCSVPQYMGKEDEYLLLSHALLDDPERIRTLSMLALSAHAWTPRARSDESKFDGGEQA